MDTARTGLFDISPMNIAAVLAVVILVGAFVWRANDSTELAVVHQPENSPTIAPVSNSENGLPTDASTDNTQTNVLGTTILANAIVEYGKATTDGASSDAGIAAVKKYAESVSPGVSYTTYTPKDILTDFDSSKDRVITYRADLRTALEPLMANKDYELDLYALYVDTKDPQYLSALRSTIGNYRLAIANTERVVAPSDAVLYHIAILSSMSQFAATLQAMIDNASDPLASTALLKSYASAQDNMVASFNAIGSYAAKKLL